MIKGFNRTLETLLRQRITEEQKKWDQYVQKLENNLQTAHQWATEHVNRGQRY